MLWTPVAELLFLRCLGSLCSLGGEPGSTAESIFVRGAVSADMVGVQRVSGPFGGCRGQLNGGVWRWDPTMEKAVYTVECVRRRSSRRQGEAGSI